MSAKHAEIFNRRKYPTITANTCQLIVILKLININRDIPQTGWSYDHW